VPVLVDGLAPLFDLPYVFYGHSMGSILAFEVAHELRACGQAFPLALFPVAHEAPAIPHKAAISELPDSELIAHVKKSSNTPQQLDDPKFLRLIIPTLRCDFSLCDTYPTQQGLSSIPFT
jgi:medium-chain acyl-[acyl-carrier-protein] hydrolase